MAYALKEKGWLERIAHGKYLILPLAAGENPVYTEHEFVIASALVEPMYIRYWSAVTDRFALETKYFYNEENLDSFRGEYAEMPFYEQAMENTLLAGGSVVMTLLVVVGLLIIGGVI